MLAADILDKLALWPDLMAVNIGVKASEAVALVEGAFLSAKTIVGVEDFGAHDCKGGWFVDLIEVSIKPNQVYSLDDLLR